MDANVSVDIGKNLTGLIGELARQIGTTADKVFPWYVKQQIIEGYSFFIMLGIALIGGIPAFLYSFRKAEKEDDVGVHVVMAGVSGVIVGVAIFCAFLGSSGAISQILNPEMGALKSMTSDMSRLIGK